jgi:uncharacterized protein (TIGR03086 family)
MDNQQVTGRTQQLDRAFASTRAVLAKVSADQLDAPTPCASWDVRALINHFVGSGRWAAVTIGAGDQVAYEDHAGGDFMASYDESIRGALVAFGAAGALERTVTLPFGEFSGAALMGLAARDQFTHGWDLARAVGLDTDLDPEVAEELLRQARVDITGAFRGSDGVSPFGPVIEAPADACPADRLAAFLGRRV